MRTFRLVTALCTIFALGGTAEADRIQLPHDPDITLGIGTGGFFGSSKRIDFDRIQPVYFRAELAVFRRDAHRWFNRMNVYCAISPEFAHISYKGRLKLRTFETDDGESYTMQEDGLERADLTADVNASGGCGIRQSIYDHPRFHLDGFGEFATSFRRVDTSPNTVIVSWGGLSLDVAQLAAENTDIDLGWGMVHAGLTLGFPIDKWKNNRNIRLTPFLIAGYIRFHADIRIAVHENFVKKLDALGIDRDIIPEQESVDKDSATASLGARLDIGRNHSLESAGSFFVTRKGTRVYWATLSYSVKFDYPW